MKFEKKYVDIKSGEKIAYLEKGSGRTVLLIHGNMSSSVHFMPLIDRMTSGYRILAPDLRGMGDSSYNKSFNTLKELSEDIKEFCDALNVSEAHVVGWSTGGGIALELAAAYPDLVLSIFSVEGASHKGYPVFKKNPDGSNTTEIYESKAAMATDPVLIAPVVMANQLKNTAFHENLWNAVMYPVNKPAKEDNDIYIAESMKQRNILDIDWSLANFNMSNEVNFYRQGDNTIKDVKCPCGFTSGESDYVVPVNMVMENINAVKDCILFKYKNCGHSPFVDMPDKLAEDIIDFYKKK